MDLELLTHLEAVMELSLRLDNFSCRLSLRGEQTGNQNVARKQS